MDQTIGFTFTRQLVRAAAWRFWAGFVGRGGILAVVLPAAVGAYFLSANKTAGLFLLVAAALGVAVFVIGGIQTVNRGMAQLRRMNAPEMTIRFTDEQIEVKSDLGAAQLPWRSIYGLRRYPDLWLVLLTKTNYMTLPTDHLDPPLREFINAKLAKVA